MLCALMSGGKDSNYALYKAIMDGFKIACLVIVKPKRDDSWLFHSVYPELALAQARSMDFKGRIYIVEVSGEKEVEAIELERELFRIKKDIGFDTLLCGAISSRYQLSRFDRIAKNIGVKLYSPLWGLNQELYMRKLVAEGFTFIITKISTMGLPKDFLAKPITLKHVEEIVSLARRYGFNPAFEGGEAETLVIDAPHYRHRVCIEGIMESKSEYEHTLKVLSYWLGEKNKDCLIIVN